MESLDQMRRYNIKTNENEFAFNLHTVEEWKQFQDGALNDNLLL